MTTTRPGSGTSPSRSTTTSSDRRERASASARFCSSLGGHLDDTRRVDLDPHGIAGGRQRDAGRDEVSSRPSAQRALRRTTAPLRSAVEHPRLTRRVGDEPDGLGSRHGRRRPVLLDVGEPEEPRHPRIGRSCPEAVGRLGLDHRAGTHDRHAPAERERLADVMGDVEHGQPELAEQLLQLRPATCRAAAGRARRAARRAAASAAAARAPAPARPASARHPTTSASSAPSVPARPTSSSSSATRARASLAGMPSIRSPKPTFPCTSR